MKKCLICGFLRRITIECERCKRQICLNDFHIQSGICVDCMTIFYAEKYREKIDDYIDGKSLILPSMMDYVIP